jgi:hypothetical protein
MEAMPMEFSAWPFLIPIVAIIGGFVLAGLGIYAQIRRREFEHRERLAMIEKGVVPPSGPPPPAGTAPGAAISTTGAVFDDVRGLGYEDRAARTRRGGFVLMAVGLGVGFMLWMTSRQWDDSIGIGGFLVILGAAIFASSFFGYRNRDRSSGDAPGGPRR